MNRARGKHDDVVRGAAEPGTAVGDLQALEKNQNLTPTSTCSMICRYSNVTANP